MVGGKFGIWYAVFSVKGFVKGTRLLANLDKTVSTASHSRARKSYRMGDSCINDSHWVDALNVIQTQSPLGGSQWSVLEQHC